MSDESKVIEVSKFEIETHSGKLVIFMVLALPQL
jgi:hypothetical protein